MVSFWQHHCESSELNRPWDQTQEPSVSKRLRLVWLHPIPPCGTFSPDVRSSWQWIRAIKCTMQTFLAAWPSNVQTTMERNQCINNLVGVRQLAWILASRMLLVPRWARTCWSSSGDTGAWHQYETNPPGLSAFCHTIVSAALAVSFAEGFPGGKAVDMFLILHPLENPLGSYFCLCFSPHPPSTPQN